MKISGNHKNPMNVDGNPGNPTKSLNTFTMI